jgi:hypothetical protein
LEKKGFTKAGFFEIFRCKVLCRVSPGRFFELNAGDGLAGSLGTWLESVDPNWRVEAWEDRPLAIKSFAKNRPQALLHKCRLISWTHNERHPSPMGITARGSREASSVCREIHRGRITPSILGIWNPTRRPVWYHRLVREGYRLELVWHNMEFYCLRSP